MNGFSIHPVMIDSTHTHLPQAEPVEARFSSTSSENGKTSLTQRSNQACYPKATIRRARHEAHAQ